MRVPIAEVKGASKVTPSPAEVQVATIGDVGEHFHLPPGQALLIVQTKLEFPETSDGPGNHSRQLLRSQRST